MLPAVIDTYNRTPHNVTGFAPRFLLYGLDDTPDFAHPLLPLAEARTLALSRTRALQEAHKRRHDAHHPIARFHLGDKVVRKVPDNHPDKHKLSALWMGPYYIVNCIGDVTYDIAFDLTEGPQFRAHASQLKLYIDRDRE